MQALRRRYLEIDPRTLGVLRIALAAFLLCDLAKRFGGIDLWYVNGGLLPNHRVLWRPSSPHQLSYLFALWTPGQVTAAFVVTGCIYLCFLVGYRTRLCHVLSWFCLLSIHTRTELLLNGGDYVLCTLLLWSAFLPLGRCYSLDALRAAKPSAATQTVAPVRSLAVLALLLQLSVIYLLSALNKRGPTWLEGSAVHYLLHQARTVTTLGIWARNNLSSEVLSRLTYGTVVVEYAMPALILWPWFGPWPRRSALLGIWSLHIGIALLSDVGVFSAAMMLFSLVLISPEDHAALASFAGPSSSVSLARARLSELLQHLRLRESRSEPAPALTALGLSVARVLALLREVCVAYLLLCACSQLVLENRALLSWIEPAQPDFVRATVSYLHLNQGWGMFAPDAPRTDLGIVVDAETESGAHIDPYNQLASLHADPSLRVLPERLGQDVYFCDYTARIVGGGLFHQPFEEWVFSHDQRTGRQDERIRRFKAYVVEHDSPPPGYNEPTNVRAKMFFEAERKP